MVQFDFAFSPTGDECVVVETDLSGNRRRGAYALASGAAQSDRLGESGMVLYDLAGATISTIRMAGTTVPEVAKLGETWLE